VFDISKFGRALWSRLWSRRLPPCFTAASLIERGLCARKITKQRLRLSKHKTLWIQGSLPVKLSHEQVSHLVASNYLFADPGYRAIRGWSVSIFLAHH
jgi:hypothetical protein